MMTEKGHETDYKRELCMCLIDADAAKTSSTIIIVENNRYLLVHGIYTKRVN